MKNAPEYRVFHTNAFPKPNIPLPTRRKRPPSHHSPGASLSNSAKRLIYDSGKLRFHTVSVCSVYSVVGHFHKTGNEPQNTRNARKTRSIKNEVSVHLVFVYRHALRRHHLTEPRMPSTKFF